MPDASAALTRDLPEYDLAYRDVFWRGRDYEDLCDRTAIRALLPPKGGRLDRGRGGVRAPGGRVHGLPTRSCSSTPRKSCWRRAGNALGPTRGSDFVLGDAYAMPFASATFDAVVCVRVAHHFAEPERVFRRDVADPSAGRHPRAGIRQQAPPEVDREVRARPAALVAVRPGTGGVPAAPLRPQPRRDPPPAAAGRLPDRPGARRVAVPTRTPEASCPAAGPGGDRGPAPGATGIAGVWDRRCISAPGARPVDRHGMDFAEQFCSTKGTR